MRRVVLVFCLILAAAGGLSACGSSSKRAAAADPRLDVLSYFPANSPFVSTVVTDPNSVAAHNFKALAKRFPIVALGETGLFTELSKSGVDYNADVRPLFGNPIAFGLTAATNLRSGQPPVLGAWQTRSAAALHRVIAKSKAHRTGTHGGATLYASTDGTTHLAVSGATVLVADTDADLDAALDRHANQQGFGATQLARDTTGLPSGSAVQMMGDLTGALSTPRAAQARQIPWVAAIRGYGAALSLSSSAVSLTARIDTGGRQLTAAQLPIASGSQAPGLVGALPILAGVRDPAQLYTFGIAAYRIIDPAAYAQFQSEVQQAAQRTGIDANSFVAKFTGDLQVQSDGHTSIGRADVSDPASVRAMLVGLLNKAAAKGGARALGGGLYAIREKGYTLITGMVGDRVVAGRAPVAQVRAFATAPAAGSAPGGGAVAEKFSLAGLAALRGSLSPTARQVLDGLGDVTSTLQSTPSASTFTAQIAFKQAGG